MPRADDKTPGVYWLVHGTGLTIFKEAQVIAYFDLHDCAKIAEGIALSIAAAENKDDRQAG
jgi:hypothetical protein